MKKYNPVTMFEGNGASWVSMDHEGDGEYVKAEVAERLLEAVDKAQELLTQIQLNTVNFAAGHIMAGEAWGILQLAKEYTEDN